VTASTSAPLSPLTDSLIKALAAIPDSPQTLSSPACGYSAFTK
jgi:hypothetical protein